MKQKQRVDHRRKIALKNLLLLERVTKCMDPITIQKTKDRLHPEYKVR